MNNKFTSSTNIVCLGFIINMFNPAEESSGSINPPTYVELLDKHTDLKYFGNQNEGGIMTRLIDESNTQNSNDDIINSEVFKIYGDTFQQRLIKFRNCERGWNMGGGEPLSSASLIALKNFLELAPKFKKKPAVFMTTSGIISIGWQDEEDNLLELEFENNGIKYIIEETNEEGLLDYSELPYLYDKISRI